MENQNKDTTQSITVTFRDSMQLTLLMVLLQTHICKCARNLRQLKPSLDDETIKKLQDIIDTHEDANDRVRKAMEAKNDK